MAQKDDPFESTRMTLGEHLAELRRRLMRSALAVVVGVLIGWAYYPELTKALQWPMDRALAEVDLAQREKYELQLAEERKLDPEVPRTKYFRSEDPTDTELLPELTVSKRWMSLGPAEQMLVAMKVALYAAIVLSGPVLLWQMWQFIAAGLYSHEKRTVLLYFPISLGLFAAGLLFGFFVLCPVGYYFLVTTYPPEEVNYARSLSDYLDSLSTIVLALGIVFQLPLVMNALIRLDLVTRDAFKNFRRYFIVGAFIVGGILTPPDPYTQVFMALPVIVLYEVGLLSTLWMKRKPKASAEGTAA